MEPRGRGAGSAEASFGLLLGARGLIRELLHLFVIGCPLRPCELARDQGELVRSLDAELAGDTLERLPLQRLVPGLVREAKHGERALEGRAGLVGLWLAPRPGDKEPAGGEESGWEPPSARGRGLDP